MVRSRDQRASTALAMLRRAMDAGWHTETDMVDYATAMMGESNRALVQSVFDRHFKIYPAV